MSWCRAPRKAAPRSKTAPKRRKNQPHRWRRRLLIGFGVGILFLVLLIPERRFLAIWIGFGIAFTLNLLAAVPPTPQIGDLVRAVVVESDGTFRPGDRVGVDRHRPDAR